jgi:hypothetical protein
MSGHLETLQWQFRMTWRLAGYHLPHLTDEACLWQPAQDSWTVRQGADGNWRPDWAETEPDPAPPTTIGWLTWHLIWWWSGIQSAVEGEKPLPRETVFWPGSASEVMKRLDTLSADWERYLTSLSESDLDRPFAHPWTEPRPLRIALAWANSELMKNIAEIGTVRHLYEARPTQR